MKILTALMLMALCVPVIDATSQVAKRKVYTAFMYPMKGGKIRGTLYKIHTSAIEITRKQSNTLVPIENIMVVSVRKRHAATRGLLIGLGTGILLGGLIGNATYHRSGGDGFLGPEINIGVGIIFGALIGGPIGDTIGRKGYRARIMGQQKNFDEHKAKLRQYQLSTE